jgi:hypothetical protein
MEVFMSDGTTIKHAFTPIELIGIEKDRVDPPKIIIHPFALTTLCPLRILHSTIEVFISTRKSDQLFRAVGYGEINVSELEHLRKGLVNRMKETEICSSDTTFRLLLCRKESGLFLRGTIAHHHERWIYIHEDELFRMMRDSDWGFFCRLDFAFMMAARFVPELIKNIATLEQETKLCQ